MKRTILLVLGGLWAFGIGAMAQVRAPGSPADQWYRQGVLAMNQGEVETAKECFMEVLRLRPNDMNARYQLRQLSLRKGPLLAKKRENQLGAVIIPQVDFEQLNLRETLEALSALVAKETEGKFAPNFIVQDREGVLDKRLFSLKLSKVPATVVLQYALENARATARYDEHAIVVKPLGSVEGSPGPVEEEKKEVSPIGRRTADPFAR